MLHRNRLYQPATANLYITTSSEAWTPPFLIMFWRREQRHLIPTSFRNGYFRNLRSLGHLIQGMEMLMMSSSAFSKTKTRCEKLRVNWKLGVVQCPWFLNIRSRCCLLYRDSCSVYRGVYSAAYHVGQYNTCQYMSIQYMSIHRIVYYSVCFVGNFPPLPCVQTVACTCRLWRDYTWVMKQYN